MLTGISTLKEFRSASKEFIVLVEPVDERSEALYMCRENFMLISAHEKLTVCDVTNLLFMDIN